MTRRGPLSVKGHFIDDLDPYEGSKVIPLPVVDESDSDEIWQEFQDSLTFEEEMVPPHSAPARLASARR